MLNKKIVVINKRKEKRMNFRIDVASTIRIDALSKNKLTASLIDISWSGLKVISDKAIPKSFSNQILTLSLPFHNGNINLFACVNRVGKIGNKYYATFRYTHINQTNETKLTQLLKILSIGSSKALTDNDLIPGIDIFLIDNQSLTSILKEISSGCLLLTLPESLKLNTSIQVKLNVIDEKFNLNLRAHAIYKNFMLLSNKKMYQTVLKFEHLNAEIKDLLKTNALMQHKMVPELN